MNRYFKTEGNIIYPDKQMLTWGPFYYHSFDKAQEKMDEILTWIINWVNEQDPSLNIQPENLIRTRDGHQIVFDIKAWKDENNLQKCDGIITVEDIFFEDEQK
jgi:hypothetical protein